MKLGYILSAHSQLGAGAAVFADEIAKRTEGRYQIEQYPNSALGGEVELLKAVQLGTVDLALQVRELLCRTSCPTSVYSTSHFFSAMLVTLTQFSMVRLDSRIWRASETKTLWLWPGAKMECDISLFPSARYAHPEDLEGLKLRVPQSDVMLAGFKALGADVSSLAFPLLYGALQSGQFDGEENPIATIQSSKFNQVQKHLTLTGHVYDPAILFMSVDDFDDLSAGDKNTFIETARLAGEASRQFAAAAEKNGVTELAQSGMEVVADVDRAKFAAAMAQANPVFAQQFGDDRIRQIREYH